MDVVVVGAGVIGLSAILIPLAAWGSGLPASVLALCTLHFLGGTWIEMTGTALRGLGRRGQEAAGGAAARRGAGL